MWRAWSTASLQALTTVRESSPTWLDLELRRRLRLASAMAVTRSRRRWSGWSRRVMLRPPILSWSGSSWVMMAS